MVSTAVVTGASRGLGAALAGELAHRGYRVAMLARSSGELAQEAAQIRAAGGTVEPIVCDIRDEKAVAGVANRLTDIDVVVSNAAVLGPVRPLLALRTGDLLDVFATNVLASATCLRYFLPGLVRRGRGVYIAVSSSAADTPLPGMAAYAASKAAFDILHRLAATEHARSGVRMRVVRPGAVDTAMQAQLRATAGVVGEGARAAARAGRLHHPVEVAGRLLDRCLADDHEIMIDLGP